MGIHFFSECGCNRVNEDDKKGYIERIRTFFGKRDVNPDPRRFEIVSTFVSAPYIAVQVTYEGCTNYEGKKVLVFEATSDELSKQSMLDPHFCEGEHLTPIARFAPTPEGWEMAVKFVGMLVELHVPEVF